MPEWIFDKNVQGVISLILVIIAGVWGVVKFCISRNTNSAVTKLEIKYPNENIEERLTKIEGMLMCLLHENRVDNIDDETSIVAQYVLDKAKSKIARVNSEGVEIKVSSKDIESVTYVNEAIVTKTLSMLEGEGLIKISGDYITVLSEKKS